MKLALNLGYLTRDRLPDLELVLEAERLGYDSVWVAESWGSDAVTVLSWIGARTSTIKLGSGILQMPARTPAMTAMTAATLDRLSDGRLLLGLGLSGPQVVEGWHGEPYGKPLGKTREYVSIVRDILRREDPLTHRGSHYEIPLTGERSTGLGKPLKLMTHPLRSDVPIYLAAIGPQNVALTAEIADGWLPVFYSPERADEVFGPSLSAGLAKAADPAKPFDVAPSLAAIISDDIEAARNKLRPQAALYVGGMGAKGRNFYNDLAARYGYAEAAERVQELYLAGDKMAALHAVPDQLLDEVNLVGTPDMVRDRLEVWRSSNVTTLLVSVGDLVTLRTLAELVL
ncbi:MAG: LLM class F420-dependent oxidoreductase [Acidimicrobiia bacterium]|nr:LLM class F420-dependent oxidoreductase [Acidimicrobiia bacterium]